MMIMSLVDAEEQGLIIAPGDPALPSWHTTHVITPAQCLDWFQVEPAVGTHFLFQVHPWGI